MALIQDNFTGNDNDLLRDHIADVGGLWNGGSGNAIIYGNQARNGGNYHFNVSAPSTNGYAQCVPSRELPAFLGNFYLQLYINYDELGSGIQDYAAFYYNAGNSKYYVSVNDGVAVEVANFENLTCKISRNGDIVSAFTNGNLVATNAANGSGHTSRRFGFLCVWANTQIDNFEAGTPATISITTNTLPSGLIDQFYGVSLSSTGATTYAYAITAGALPPGLVLATNQISGYPTIKGLFPVTITATGDNGAIDTQDYVISIGDKFSANAGDALAKVAILNTGDDANLEQQIQNITSNDYGVSHKVVDVNFNAVGGYAQVDVGFMANKWEVMDKKNVPSGTYLEIKQTSVDNRYLILQSVGALGTIKLHLWG